MYITESIFTNGTAAWDTLLIATAVTLVLGLFIAWAYQRRNECSKSFARTLVVLPLIVELVILLVNGNIGAGVAVAGAFSLIRFRSAQGSGQEIAAVFLSMAIGLATGMGYVGAAVLFAIAVVAVSAVLEQLRFGERAPQKKMLRIAVPESLDYEGVFDDIFAKYTTKSELTDVRTEGMGTVYKVTYEIVMRSDGTTKAMIDELRTRNGNLEISCARPADTGAL